MTTQMSSAQAGKITLEMKKVARDENEKPDAIRRRVAKGTVVIPRNVNRENTCPIGIGEGLRVKINANIGTSVELSDVDLEVEKAKIAVKYGADTIMDLSTNGNLDEIRKKILKTVNAPIGTVPIYQTAVEARGKRGAIVNMTEDDIFRTIEKHAKDGVDFITVHCGITRQIVDHITRHPRLMGIVSRGGTFLATWMLHNKKENPLYKEFDQLLEIAREHDVTLSLGDALRPGCIADASDAPQIQELITLGELVQKARKANVQTMVEGPGHLPLNHVEANVLLEKSVCKNAPFYVLGPLVTDIAPGYDHIVSAVGGAIAGMAGADFLCYVTPAEHLGLPRAEDVREGVVAAKIAAHAVDIIRLGERASLRDYEMSKARATLDWKRQIANAIDSEKAKAIRGRLKLKNPDACSMCGEYCAIKMLRDALKTEGQCI